MPVRAVDMGLGPYLKLSPLDQPLHVRRKELKKACDAALAFFLGDADQSQKAVLQKVRSKMYRTADPEAKSAFQKDVSWLQKQNYYSSRQTKPRKGKLDFSHYLKMQPDKVRAAQRRIRLKEVLTDARVLYPQDTIQAFNQVLCRLRSKVARTKDASFRNLYQADLKWLLARRKEAQQFKARNKKSVKNKLPQPSSVHNLSQYLKNPDVKWTQSSKRARQNALKLAVEAAERETQDLRRAILRVERRLVLIRNLSRSKSSAKVAQVYEQDIAWLRQMREKKTQKPSKNKKTQKSK